jgi:hypothetical protein
MPKSETTFRFRYRFCVPPMNNPDLCVTRGGIFGGFKCEMS